MLFNLWSDFPISGICHIPFYPQPPRPQPKIYKIYLEALFRNAGCPAKKGTLPVLTQGSVSRILSRKKGRNTPPPTFYLRFEITLCVVRGRWNPRLNPIAVQSQGEEIWIHPLGPFLFLPSDLKNALHSLFRSD